MAICTRWSTVLAMVIGASLISWSCDGKDSEKCREGQEGVRASLKAKDSAALQKWRNYAFKACEEGEFQALDREIQETQAAEKKKEAEEKKKLQENQQLLDVFLGWVGSTKASPQTAAAPTCEGDENAAKKQERWCVGDRMAGTNRFEVRYWEKEPVAVDYIATIPNPISCAAVGTHTIIRSWTVQGTIKRHHCQITGGPAAGMQALVTEAQNAPLEVFSPRFVELHAGLRTRLQGM